MIVVYTCEFVSFGRWILFLNIIYLLYITGVSLSWYCETTRTDIS